MAKVRRDAGEHLGFPEAGHRDVLPLKVLGLAAGVDHARDEDPPQHRGGGAGELTLAGPRLAAHQERPLGRQGGEDGVRARLVEQVHRAGPGAAAGQLDAGIDGDVGDHSRASIAIRQS